MKEWIKRGFGLEIGRVCAAATLLMVAKLFTRKEAETDKDDEKKG